MKSYEMNNNFFFVKSKIDPIFARQIFIFLPAGAQLGVHKRICTPSIRGFSLKLKTLHSIKAEVGWISFTINFRSVYTSSMPGLGAEKN